MKTRILYLAALFLMGAPVWGSDLQIILTSPTLTAAPGQQIMFSGKFSNKDFATLDLNDISVTLDGMFLIDALPFFLGPLTLDASTPLVTSETIEFALFSILVDIPYTDAVGLKSGTVTILGGVEGPGGYDPSAQNQLGSAVFSVNVVAAPETSSLLMMSAGVLFVFLRRRVR